MPNPNAIRIMPRTVRNGVLTGKRDYMDMKAEEERRVFDKRNLQRLAENLQPQTHMIRELQRKKY